MENNYRYFKDNSGNKYRIHIEYDENPLDPRIDFDGCHMKNPNMMLIDNITKKGGLVMAAREKNPCLGCGCYDSDVGCTMPSHDKWYACPIYDNSKELAEILYAINKDMDFGDYSDTEKKSIENLANDISKARELGLEYLISALGCICMGEVYGKT